MVPQRQALYSALVTTSDPTKGIVRVVMKGDNQERGVGLYSRQVASRWPQVGETWRVEQKNGTWYLEGEAPSPNSQANNVAPGDAMIHTPTGVVRVIDDKGQVNFSIAKANVPTGGTATLTFSSSVNASIQVAHGLGVVPATVVANPVLPSYASYQLTLATGLWDKVHFTIFATSNNALAGTVTVSWFAMA